MKTEKNYSIPRLCSRNGDITKYWYVYFNYTDHLSGEKKQFRYKFGINQLKTKREREREAGSIITALHLKLQDGWNPLTDKTEEETVDMTVSQALDEMLSLKKSYITPRSYKTYYDQLNLFKKWLVIKKYDKLFVYNLTGNQALQYLDYLLKVKGYCGKTYNGHLGVMKSFFNAILEREYIKKNPFEGIKQVRQDTGKNTTYSAAEEIKLEAYMYEHERNFYYTTRFVRYCFFRRSELSKIQIKHINWENKTIIVPSDSAQSRVQDSITISKTLEKCIREMGILSLDPNMYIFGKNFIPSFDKLKRVDDFSDMQRYINRKNNIKEECTFYSWKHTGAVELYNLTKDPYTVMRQCRHSDIKMTMIYLRSMGCGVNEQVREW